MSEKDRDDILDLIYKGMGRKKRGKRCGKGPEAQVLDACLCLLIHRGYYTWRQNVGALNITDAGGERFVRFGLPGQTDVTGITKDGRRLDIEIKRPGLVPTKRQYEFITAMLAYGGVAFWVDDVKRLSEILDHVEAGGTVSVGDKPSYIVRCV